MFKIKFRRYTTAIIENLLSLKPTVKNQSISIMKKNVIFTSQNDIVLVRRYSNPVEEVRKHCQVGSVVCLRRPRRPEHLLIKRLASFEGSFSGRDIPEGHCWVASDAGKGYLDSSIFGVVPLQNVIGDATFVVFPPNRIGRIPVTF